MQPRSKCLSSKPIGYFGLMMPIMAAFFVSSLLAQPIMRWDSSGVNLRQGHHIEWFATGAQDPVSGDMIVVWSDCRNGDRDIFAQKIDLSGIPLWEEDGKLICQAIGRQLDPEVIYSENGNWIIAWVDYRWNPNWIEAGDVYVQKVNSNGEPLWNPEGVAVCLEEEVQLNLRLVSDGSGGVIIVWEDNRSGDGNDIYAQHVMSNGQVAPGWLLNGLPVISYLGSQEEIAVDTDGSGGAIVVWTDTRFSANKNIYAQRITPQGTLLWNTTGQAICTYNYDQFDPELCSDGQGGAFIVWLDTRFDHNFGDIFFQHVNSSGTALLQADGRELCTAPMEQKECRLIASEDGGAIFCWVDFRYDEQNTISDIFAQKVNSSGNALWGNNGLAVCTADESQMGARLTSDGLNGAIIGWEDIRNGNSINDADLYAQRISSAGLPMWIADGVLVCDAAYYQNSVLLKSDLSNGAFFFWGNSYDWSTSGLYEQRLNSSGVPQLQPNGALIHYGIDGNAEDPMMVQTIPGQVLVAWRDFRNGQNACLYIQLIDTSGATFFESDGRPICEESLNGNMDTPQLVTDFQNGGLLVWKETRSPNLFNQIYAQRIDPNGNTMWTEGGVYIYPRVAGQQNPFIAGDGTGGAFVVWSGNTINQYLHVYAQRLNASGSQVWAEPIEVSGGVGFDDELFGVAPDGEGGVILVWRAGPWPYFYILAQKLDQNGNEIWQSGGLRVSNTNADQGQPAVITDGNGGGVFAWRDKRDLEYYNLFAQKIDCFGNLLWSDSGLSVCNVPSDKSEARLVLDCDGNVFVVWEDFRNETDQDLYLQKITPSGELAFPVSGLPVCILEDDQLDPQMVSDTRDGIYITWEGYQLLTGTHADIFCTHINGEGELAGPEGLWQENGNVVCEAIMWQLYPTIAPDGGGGSIISWQDNRALSRVDDWTYNIFAQRMNDGTCQSAVKSTPHVSLDYRLEQNYPNPFNPATRISYSLAQAGHVKLMIYDILGRKVRTIQNQFMTAGSHQIIWNGDTSSGDPVASGIYFYKLEANNHSEIRKMVLLK